MELRIGLYEFFAYTLGGVSYLISVALIDALWSAHPTVLPAYADLSAVQFIAAGVGAYVVGLVLDLPARTLLRGVFRRHAQPITADRLKAEGIIEDDMAGTPWPLILAELSLRQPAVVRNADSYKAASILLRNLSLAAMMVFLAAFGAAVNGRLVGWFAYGCPAAAAAVALFAGFESRKFDRWFYSTLYERIAVLRRLKAALRDDSARRRTIASTKRHKT